MNTRKMTFKDFNQRESFGKKFVREGDILKMQIAKLPDYNTVKLAKKVSHEKKQIRYVVNV